MYSVVLLMAMSGAPDAPAGFFKKNRGCDGGCNGYAAACYGGGYAAGCYGGGGCDGGRGGLFAKKRNRGGGCYGGGGGCYGGGGCTGYVASNCGCGPTVAVGCWGGGGGCYGGMGAGCYGGMGGMVVPMAPGGTGTPPAVAPKPPTGGGGTTPPVIGGGLPVAYSAAPATLVVSLPEGASLKIDGTPTQATTAVRQFSTPALAYGQSYYYTLTAEVVRDGQTYAATQRVTVRAGQTSQVEMPATAFGTAVAAR